jgi:hypothetical protein
MTMSAKQYEMLKRVAKGGMPERWEMTTWRSLVSRGLATWAGRYMLTDEGKKVFSKKARQ